MRFTAAAIVALCSLGGSDAFMALPFAQTLQTHAPTPTRPSTTSSVSIRTRMAGDGFSEDFEDALKVGSGSGDDEEEDVASGSSRFKELLQASKASGGAEEARIPVPIENPFLKPSPPPPSQPLASTPNPDELSVEEQARMFREMMAQQQSAGAAVPSPPPTAPQAMDPANTYKTAKTDRAGRPVGRNRDADTIANTADLYFAQLKRDSTVRTMARIHGEDDVAEKVFEDEGIQELSGLLVKNPHLKGHREKEMQLIEEVPEEALAPYFRSDDLSEEEKAQSGPSYKKKLLERKQKLKNAAATPPAPEAVETMPIDNTPPVAEQAAPEPVASAPAQTAATPILQSNPDETRQKLRTLMGLILKHRGGPNFGKGRLKGPEIDRFEVLLNDVTNLLREEAKHAQPVDTPLASTTPPETPATVTYQAPAVVPVQPAVPAAPAADVSSSAGASTSIDSMIACIEGAVTMYKNSPPALQQSVLVTLHAALVAAVNTSNSILASQPPPVVGANPDGNIDSTIAVIEGAITMYKNSPPELKDSVLVTLRAALISAVETCSLVVGGAQAAPVSPPVQTAPEVVAPAKAMDPNSQKLEGIYENLKASAGDGRLGLRSDITAEEAGQLADQLVEMRTTLMEEIEIVPTPKPTAEVQSTGSAPKYQQMLAKARAKKAAG